MKTIREVQLEEENKKLNLYIEFYKDIIDKAIEYIKIGLCNEDEEEDLLNILQGSDKE